MRDLKDLLGPLSDHDMPDRWSEIQRREPSRMPEPRRGSRIPTYAVSLAAAALVVLLVVRLAPLGGDGTVPREPAVSEPPQWLVNLAYEQAFQNGDITPTSAEWVLSDANAVAPAVGLQTGDPSVQEYLVVLGGDFTAYMASVPPGASLPTGSVLSFAADASTHEITDWGVSGQRADVQGLTPFTLPDASQTYTDPAGWTVPVPPGWSVQAVDLSTTPGEPIHGAMFATHSSLTVSGPPDGPPQASGVGFPGGGVALTIAGVVHNWGGEKVWEPPLSVDDMVKGSALAGSPTFDDLTFSGPNGQWYAMTLTVGPGASDLDVAAAASMVHALTFSDRSSPAASPSASTSAAVPTGDAVVGGRFVVPVALDDGRFRVDVAAADLQPTVPVSDARTKALADPIMQGMNDTVFGFGLVTSTVSGTGVQTVESMPAWIAFGWGGITNCPMITGPLNKYHLPSSGYVAVVIPAGQDGTPFDYRAKTSTCGYAPTGPSVAQARQTVSIPWTQVGPLDGTTVTVRYAVSSCGTKPTFTAGGRRGTYTLSVLTTLPDASRACASPVSSTSTFELAPSPGPGTPTFDIVKLLHGPLGPVAQMNR